MIFGDGDEWNRDLPLYYLATQLSSRVNTPRTHLMVSHYSKEVLRLIIVNSIGGKPWFSAKPANVVSDRKLYRLMRDEVEINLNMVFPSQRNLLVARPMAKSGRLASV